MVQPAAMLTLCHTIYIFRKLVRAYFQWDCFLWKQTHLFWGLPVEMSLHFKGLWFTIYMSVFAKCSHHIHNVHLHPIPMLKGEDIFAQCNWILARSTLKLIIKVPLWCSYSKTIMEWNLSCQTCLNSLCFHTCRNFHPGYSFNTYITFLAFFKIVTDIILVNVILKQYWSVSSFLFGNLY